MEMFNDMAGPKASGTSYQQMFAAAPPVAASSSCSAMSSQNSAGFTSGGFSDSQSLGISCQPLTSADSGAEQDEDDDEDDGQAEPVRKKGRKAKRRRNHHQPQVKERSKINPPKAIRSRSPKTRSHQDFR